MAQCTCNEGCRLCGANAHAFRQSGQPAGATASISSMALSPFVVLVDSREQLPFAFDGLRADAREGGGPLEVSTQVRGLAAGDYSIDQMESEIAIKRKSLTDLYSTLGQGRTRFETELQNLDATQFAAVIVEASWSDIAFHPPALSRMRPKAVVRSIFAFSIRFPRVHWFPMGSRNLAEAATYRLLDRFWRDKQKAAEDATV